MYNILIQLFPQYIIKCEEKECIYLNITEYSMVQATYIHYGKDCKVNISDSLQPRLHKMKLKVRDSQVLFLGLACIIIVIT